MPHTELVIALVLLIAMLCQWTAWRVRLPAILFLLIVGLVAGPISGWLNPDLLLGELLMPMVSLSVAIILFEGSLTLNLHEIRDVSKVVQRMITVGALATWVIVALATRFILDFSWQVSALFGAIMIVTGPTVIVPMLRSVRPNSKISNILRWEGIAIDPIGALMAVLAYEFILASLEHQVILHVLGVFLETVLVGGISGIVAGYVLGRLLTKSWIPDYLQNMATLSMVLASFSIANATQHESGLITVTVMGMWLANRREVDIHPILNFKEHLSLLLISILFILLAARIDLEQLTEIGWQALLLLLVLQFIARPVKIWISTVGLDVSWPERGLLAWIAPRGIVAAAIAAIFADKLVAAGYEDAALLVPLTFSMIIGTVVLQSSTARLLAVWLGVAEPPPRGYLLIGANAFSIALAKELNNLEIRCVLADPSWDSVREARMAGLETYYGNPVSDHADLHLDLSGIRGVLALSRLRYINVIAAVHFRADFGADKIFSVAALADKNQADQHKASSSYLGRRLFRDDYTYLDLVGMVAKGQRIKRTTLTEEFDWQTYCEKYAATRLPLFLVDAKGIATPFSSDAELKPTTGATILSLPLREEGVPEIEAVAEPLPDLT
ncbi:sodium/proton antiporter, CPA1 family [Nitrosomonas cryotolerans]|uniref:NhaP-type Na+/H+ or K+/H+ antiporter n=1 Tax=Nitrosomonas cryotolerans ATCC 49181 TaxID=1131553 RepID=A0A1N6GNM4_9PROT|nr:sodium:proton antiporter [Nitrosomonas cryotolerans]SFP39193.1 sodium/proton antiporter, CPA1 family [Nitrosomonas cryotolerans]SIO09097.1 NhaP-type Na+/H+ or K+/H+ antiporter [Nitrosomonas cryotolerans ATCC 49181]